MTKPSTGRPASPADVASGMGTLYVSDLDGTLLDRTPRLSDRSRCILNDLLDSGLQFTVASARSVVSMRTLLGDLRLRLPVIEFNGAFISEWPCGRHVVTQALSAGTAGAAFRSALDAGVTPFVSTFDGVRDRLYAPEPHTPGMEWYVNDRRLHGDERLSLVADVSVGLSDQVVCLTMIATEAELVPLRGRLESMLDGEIRAHLMENRYQPGWYWLTVHATRATKATAIRDLQEREGLLGAELVAFGDGENDLGMLDLADRAIAPANAPPEVRACATRIIAAHTSDSVARFIRQDWQRGSAAARLQSKEIDD